MIGAAPGVADADPASRPSAARRRSTPRAVVRWRLIKLRFALEGRHPTRPFGGIRPRARYSGRVRHARLVIVAALAAGLVAAAPAGALNPQSAGLQVALRFQGLYAGPIDGLVGAGTVEAVRAFQRRQGLPSTGRADVRTRAALGPLGRPLFGWRHLLKGMLGWDVAVLQFLIARQGIAVPVTGYFDRPTAAALRVYQRRLRLRADAIAGPATFAAFGLQTHVPVPTVQLVALKLYVVRDGDSLAAI